MEFDPTSPIWLQLVAEFSRRIAVGEWEPGGRIVGVRDLALELGVNPNTVQRALAELERAGLCHTERTAGRFVTADADLLAGLRRELAASAADDFIARAHGFGMSKTQAVRFLTERWTDHDSDTVAAEGA